MKIFKRILLVVAVAITSSIVYNYPKLNILAGYSAKHTASSVFLANRSLALTDSTDTNFSPVHLASDTIDLENKTATSSVFGLLTRKAIYREGLGSVLTLKTTDETTPYLVPDRSHTETTEKYPFWNASQKDTLFTNINYKKLQQSIDLLCETSNTRAVVVIYKDKIIAEKYARGFHQDAKILGWSMTKSIVSTVFGVLQYQGKVNVQDKAPIASWQNDARKDITLHNLLQMNSGLEWDENYDEISDATKMLFLDRDMSKMQEYKPLVGKPNESWNYSSGTTNLLSGVLRNLFETHQDYLDFWYSGLIDKIGMSSMVLEADLSGNYVGSSYAWATARDWAKFGLLYLHRGNWNGEQLFAEEWVDYVTTPTPGSNGLYGAHFWLNRESQLKDVPKNMYFADGYQGQRVYVLPDQDLVVVRFGLSWFEENEFLKSVLESID